MIGRPTPSTGRLTVSARAYKNKSRKASPTPSSLAEDSDAHVDVASKSPGNTGLESQDYDLDGEDDDIFSSEDDDMNGSQDKHREMDGEDRGP